MMVSGRLGSRLRADRSESGLKRVSRPAHVRIRPATLTQVAVDGLDAAARAGHMQVDAATHGRELEVSLVGGR